MDRRSSVFARPVAGPLFSSLSSGVTAYASFTAGYLLTESVRWGIYFLLFMTALLMLYIAASVKESTEGSGR